MRGTIVMVALAAGCGVGSSGSGAPLDVRIGATAARAIPGGFVAPDLVGSDVTVTRAVARVERIDFSLPDGTTCDDLDPASLSGGATCDGPDTVRVGGERVADLVTRTTEPSLEGITVPSLPYRRVDVRFSEADGDPVLGDDTLLVEADVDGQPVSIRLRFSEDARFEADGGLVADQAAAAMLMLSVDDWFASVDLAACAAQGGVVEESSDGACDIEGALRDAIKESGQLAQDDDGDGEIDDHGADDH